MINVSVVIPTFRHQQTLRELLGSLERQTCSVPFEVIVVANLPEVGLKKVVESYGPRFRFHETGKVGTNIARNKGFDLARGQILLFVDDDSYLGDREFVQKHYNAHLQHPQAIAIGGAYSPKSAMTTVETAYHWILDHRFLSVRLERDEARTLMAGNVSLKRQMLEQRHRFDERNRFGASEESFFAKLRSEQNLFLIFDSLSLEHRVHVGWFSLMRKGFYQGYGRKLSQSDGNSLLERPHWNSKRPLAETFRSAHLAQTKTFRLAVRLYQKAYSYGEDLAICDAVPRVATTAIKPALRARPEFSLARALAILVHGRRGKRLLRIARQTVIALRGALALNETTVADSQASKA